MKKLNIILLVLFLSACTTFKQSEQLVADTDRQIKESRQVKVDIAYTEKEKNEDKKALKKQLWKKAEKKGMRKINQSWLGRRLLLPMSNATVFASPEKKIFVQHKGKLTLPDSEEILPYVRFRVSASFFPVKQLSGTIVKIEKGRTIAGEDSQVSMKFPDIKPTRDGAYFLIARPEKIDQKNYVRVIGSGKIFNSMQDLSQGILLETSQEILVGDNLYLLQTMVRPAKEKNKDKIDATGLDQEERIVVEPISEPKASTPKGSK